jgi:broad specificity phosphatase PhoE
MPFPPWAAQGETGMRLILVRHGETGCNAREVWHGWDDCELTAVGLAQARDVGTRLTSEPVAAVHSSDSPRALQTARAIAAPHGLVPVPEPGLRERHSGVFEGLVLREIEERYPTVWQDRNADLWGWAPPGGETLSAVLERALAVVDRLARLHGDATVVAVSHMSTVRALISRLGAIPLVRTYENPFPSTGVTIITLDAGDARLEVLNDVSHVGGRPPPRPSPASGRGSSEGE